jgi:Rrf2 family protein
MLSSSRFVVASHVMTLLAMNAGKGPLCSSTIAHSVETNPVVIRRLMSELESAGLVASTSGRAGGFLLTKPANEISLASIYNAVEDEQMFRMHRESNEPGCEVARAILCALMPRLAEASKAMTEKLGGTMLNQIVPLMENNAQAAMA